jgi:hypothetical protein
LSRVEEGSFTESAIADAATESLFILAASWFNDVSSAIGATWAAIATAFRETVGSDIVAGLKAGSLRLLHNTRRNTSRVNRASLIISAASDRIGSRDYTTTASSISRANLPFVWRRIIAANASIRVWSIACSKRRVDRLSGIEKGSFTESTIADTSTEGLLILAASRFN